jgi:hypothetical protein
VPQFAATPTGPLEEFWQDLSSRVPVPLLVCAFAFEASVHEQTAELTKELQFGKLRILPVRMNPDLAIGDELLKKPGSALCRLGDLEGGDESIEFVHRGLPSTWR